MRPRRTHATLEQLAGLSPAFVILDEKDILREEGEQYAKKRIQAAVRIRRYVHSRLIGITSVTKSTVQIVSDKLAEVFG
jgi:acetyl esterase/lipase